MDGRHAGAAIIAALVVAGLTATGATVLAQPTVGAEEENLDTSGVSFDLKSVETVASTERIHDGEELTPESGVFVTVTYEARNAGEGALFVTGKDYPGSRPVLTTASGETYPAVARFQSDGELQFVPNTRLVGPKDILAPGIDGDGRSYVLTEGQMKSVFLLPEGAEPTELELSPQLRMDPWSGPTETFTRRIDLTG